MHDKPPPPAVKHPSSAAALGAILGVSIGLSLGVSALLAGAVQSVSARAQLDQTFLNATQHPAIQYENAATDDVVARLNGELASGAVRLTGGEPLARLRSILRALDVPLESQVAVFSRTGIQAALTSRRNPRVLFFNDSVVVGWVRGGFVEVAVQSPRQGAVFYSLEQDSAGVPTFRRRTECLRCHHSYSTSGVPGMIVRSVFPGSDGFPMRQLGDYFTDDRSPFEERWGGWYVTGTHGSMRHMGNATVADPERAASMVSTATLNLPSLEGKVDAGATLTPHSDIVALLVLEHQIHMNNLFTRIGWEVRLAAHETPPATVPISDLAREVVDYMLFVDEVPLTSPVRGSSGFAQAFAGSGPRDASGRSLRQLDLERRLLRYPCSFTIYGDVFDALPADAKAAIYARMWEVLSGQERDARHARVSSADKQAIIDILRATKKDLPAYFVAAR